MLTMSTVLRRRRPIGADYAAYFARPYAVARTFVKIVAEVARERRAAGWQRRNDVQPRIARSRQYALVRAYATVIQLDLQIAAVVGDVLAGRPVVYTTFLAYDEVAHHSGIERPDALAVLRSVDRQLARVEAALADAPRPYRLVVLSDHGQSQGATFLQRYDMTLEDLVRSACEADDVIAAAGGQDEALAYLSAGLTELARDDTMAGRAVRTATRKRRADGVVALDEDAREELEATHPADAAKTPQIARGDDGDEFAPASPAPPAEGLATQSQARESDALPDLSVMASGCLGLISFPREPGRVTLERLEQLHPRLVGALREHPGIGFVLVRTERDGSVVLGARGVRYLDDDRVEGEDPLAPFGPNAADHVRRTDAFPHCPDLMVNSSWWEEARRSRLSRSSSARTAGSAGRRASRSCCSRPTCPGRSRAWWARATSTACSATGLPGSGTRATTAGRATPRARARARPRRAPARRPERRTRAAARTAAAGAPAPARAGRRCPSGSAPPAAGAAGPPPRPHGPGPCGPRRASGPSPRSAAAPASRPPARAASSGKRSVSPAK